MESALAVANFFVDQSLNTGEPLTPIKLIKLVYISHGWYLALNDDELLSEAVEAWQYGPVVPTVYHKFKQYGNGQIKAFANELINQTFYVPKVHDEETINFLQEIWDQYKQYDGLQLSTLTHLPETPWYIVYNHPGNKGKKGILIPNNLIKEHYKEKLNANRKALGI
jgi:uncharacterized phage-associated protein